MERCVPELALRECGTNLTMTADNPAVDSGLVEQVLEYRFLGELTAELMRRHLRFEVLKGAFDLDGHDVVIEAGGITRHIQLKGIARGGKARHVPVNTRLGYKPSGCVIWLVYDPATFAITGWRWFGGDPGQPLPDAGGRIARHSRANSSGIKADRPHIRLLPATRFENLSDVAALADRLFGSNGLACLRRYLQRADARDGTWTDEVHTGNFAAIPKGLDWDSSGELAHLVDGYALARDLGITDPFAFEEAALADAMARGVWQGDAARLWVLLFLQHRRWRFSSPFEPDAAMIRLLDTLVRQLRHRLAGDHA
jgi:hypothetical protein